MSYYEPPVTRYITKHAGKVIKDGKWPMDEVLKDEYSPVEKPYSCLSELKDAWKEFRTWYFKHHDKNYGEPPFWQFMHWLSHQDSSHTS